MSHQQQAAVWKWENDDGSKFIPFDSSDADQLEQALNRGLPTFQHPSRPWVFNFEMMTQTNTGSMSKRTIKRLAPHTAPVGHLSAAYTVPSTPHSYPPPPGYPPQQSGYAPPPPHNSNPPQAAWQPPPGPPPAAAPHYASAHPPPSHGGLQPLPPGWREAVVGGKVIYINDSQGGRQSVTRPV